MITVSNPGRVVFPASGHTKGCVVEHYRRVAARMLPHVLRRPLSLKRYPRGVQAPGFFQKNVSAHYPDFIERIEMRKKDGVTTHPSVHDADGLAYLANQGTIELHVPTVRAPDLLHPDRIVVDLDPPPGEVALARRAALLMRTELETFGMPTAVLATGSKGYHLVGAIDPTTDLETISTAMQQLAAIAVHRHPETMTTVFRVAKRGKRVFVDWLRNAYAATVVAPYSLRARPNATVAVPIEWSELEHTAPDAFHLGNIAQRLEHDDPLATLAERPVDAAPFVAAVGATFDEAGLVLETFDRFRG